MPLAPPCRLRCRRIQLRHARRLAGDPLPQVGRRQDFDIGAELEDVHDQFAMVGVGKLQQPGTVCVESSLLLRVPGFLRDPARALGVKRSLACCRERPENMP